MAHPKAIGNQTEAMVLAGLLKQYDTVLIPFGENQRYDFVVDAGETFFRVQCKTGRLSNGVIVFKTASTTYHHRTGVERRKGYVSDVDHFGVYCPETDKVYLVPVDTFGIGDGSLRVTPPRNNQARGIRWAKDFELAGLAQSV